MDGLGLPKKRFKKVLKKHHLLRLENMLKIDVSGKEVIFRTFYKVKGVVIEPEQKDKYKPSEIETEKVKLNEKSQKLAETESEFKELFEFWLTKNEIYINDTSLRQTAIKKLIKDLRKARVDYDKICLDNSFGVDYELLDATKRYIEFLKEMELQKGKRLHPSFDPNLWSSKTYELFKYLYDNYYDNKFEGEPTKRKLTNIWFYLRSLENDYSMYMTKGNYKAFIQNYNVEIKNFDKADKYHYTELPKMNDHRIEFENRIK